MKGLLALIGSLACAWLWIGVVAPLIARTFGVPMKVGLWRVDRQNRHLTRRQFFWSFGLLGWAVGMFLLFFLFDHLDWSILGSSHPSVRRTVASLIGSIVGGVAVGSLGYPGEKITTVRRT